MVLFVRKLYSFPWPQYIFSVYLKYIDIKSKENYPQDKYYQIVEEQELCDAFQSDGPAGLYGCLCYCVVIVEPVPGGGIFLFDILQGKLLLCSIPLRLLGDDGSHAEDAVIIAALFSAVRTELVVNFCSWYKRYLALAWVAFVGVVIRSSADERSVVFALFHKFHSCVKCFNFSGVSGFIASFHCRQIQRVSTHSV